MRDAPSSDLAPDRDVGAVPSFSLTTAAAAAGTWAALGFWCSTDLLEDASHALRVGCIVLATCGAIVHAGLFSFERFRALGGRRRITAVWLVTLALFVVVRIVRRS